MFIYNPQSGKKKSAKKVEYIKKTLSEKFEEFTAMPTSSKQDFLDQIKVACKTVDVLVFSGGDGTVNDVVNVVVKNNKNLILGYIPSGTCNDFARSVGISKNVKKALKTICEKQPQKFDGFCVNGRYGAYVCAGGIFTSASYDTKQKTKRLLGKFGYYLHSAKEVFSSKSLEITYSLDNKEEKYCDSVLFLLMNSCSIAGWKVNKESNIHDGKMDFVSVETKKKNKKIGFRAFWAIVRLFLFGIKSVKNSKLVRYSKFETAKIKSPKSFRINVDGEDCGTGEIDIKVQKDMFTLIA